jgi:hypothetical protein
VSFAVFHFVVLHFAVCHFVECHLDRCNYTGNHVRCHKTGSYAENNFAGCHYIGYCNAVCHYNGDMLSVICCVSFCCL